MPYVVMLVTCVLVGVLAQKVRGHRAAAWMAVTATILQPTWFVCYLAGSSFDGGPSTFALALTVCAAVGALMAAVVAARPRRREQSARGVAILPGS
jgi:hypothetical protein